MKKRLNRFLEKRVRRIQRLSSRQSNMKLALMKAYAIISVVASHSGGGGIQFPMTNWVSPYFFFMPLFIFTSGYFYKEQYDGKPVFSYVWEKSRQLVVPYFGWNVVYGMLNLMLRKLSVIRFGRPFGLHSLFIQPWIDGHQFAFNIPSWFLLSLFMVSVGTYLLRLTMKKLHCFKDSFVLILTLGVSLLSIYLSQNYGANSGWKLCFVRAGFLLPYFQLGYMYKRKETFFTEHRLLLMALIYVTMYTCWVCAGKEGFSVNVVFAKFTGSAFLNTIMVICGIMLTALVCEYLAPAFDRSKIVNAIGENTFSIMMHHGFVIFLINLFLSRIYPLLPPSPETAVFDYEKFQTTLWYTYPWKDSRIIILYVVLGIGVPVLLKMAFDCVVLRLYEKRTESWRENEN